MSAAHSHSPGRLPGASRIDACIVVAMAAAVAVVVPTVVVVVVAVVVLVFVVVYEPLPPIILGNTVVPDLGEGIVAVARTWW